MEEPTEPSRKAILDDWFDNKFCAIYQNTTKVEHARRLMHRYQPDENTLEKILQFVMEDNRRRKFARDRKEFYPPACNAFSFFNESRWMDKIRARSDVEEVHEQHKCSKCSADGFIKVKDSWFCNWHYSNEHSKSGVTGMDALRERWTKLNVKRNPGESWRDAISRTHPNLIKNYEKTYGTTS